MFSKADVLVSTFHSHKLKKKKKDKSFHAEPEGWVEGGTPKPAAA